MAIDFCVDYVCEAKRMLGSDGMLDLVQSRVAYDATQRSGQQRREHDFWTRVVRGPEKDRVEMVSVGNLRRKSNRLVEFTSACDGCPANVRDEPAGCFGRITYPIDAPAERRLAESAAAVCQAPAESPARAFVEWIDEGPVDGRRVRRMRDAVRTGVRFFELAGSLCASEQQAGASPASRDAAGPVTTDQVIEMMFFPFPNRKGGFHFVIPREALSTHRAFLGFVLNDMDLGHRRQALEQSTTLEQLRLYARALSAAEKLGVDLLVD